MTFTLSNHYLSIFSTICIIWIAGYIYFKWYFKYWERKGIPYVESTFPFGSLNNPMVAAKSFGENCQSFYNTLKSKGCKHGGIYTFTIPAYMPIDVEIVKSILQKDFDHFTDRGVFYNEIDDPLTVQLFSAEGTKWKNLRVKFTPMFTSGKIKMMFPILVECGNQLKEALDVVSEKNEAVDIKDFAARFTTNIIGSCAFGIDCNCFRETNSDFRKYGNRILAPGGLDALYAFTCFSSPGLAKRLRLRIVPKDATRFFMDIIKKTVNYRRHNEVIRNDFMQLLIDIKNSVKDEKGNGIGLTFQELASQAFIFFLAGYETSSTTMTFCLFELASNPDIQQKVRDEINDVLGKYNNEINYDALTNMNYMGQVIDETLRKYPPLAILNRKCVKPYRIPNTDIVLEKDTSVVISSMGLQRDPEYFPEPEKFDPDRFSKENKDKVIPFTYLPFGDGPRICIGLRFGIMQVKVGLTVLLRNYKFSLNNKTKTPLEMDPFTFILSVKGDVWLDTEKIKPV